MPPIQELIYKWDEAEGRKIIEKCAVLLVLIGILILYDVKEYKNFTAPEAMDAAQVARNIADGKGFSTLWIRPFALYLIQSHQKLPDPVLKDVQPDLANPPVYPLMLALLMRIFPFDFTTFDGRYSPEIIITIFNQCLFLLAAFLLYKISLILFDKSVGFFSVAVMIGSELFLKFSSSGLPTMLLILVFELIIWLLIRWLDQVRSENPSKRNILIKAAFLGIFLAIGLLTQYSFGFLFIPVLIFFIIYGQSYRVSSVLVFALVFIVLISPWLARNIAICGKPFGTQGYAIIQETSKFSDNALDRELKPDFSGVNRVYLDDLAKKLTVNLHKILTDVLPGFTGNWLAAFFLAGLIIPYKNPVVSALRNFIILSFVTLIPVMALNQTWLSTMSRDVHSENIVFWLAPIVILYGAALFFILLDQINIQNQLIKNGVLLFSAVIFCLPLLITFLPPREVPVAWPPYYPPLIKQISGFFKNNELIMTDIPWAVAWYGKHQAISLTPDPKESFFRVNDVIKPVNGIYITQVTMDSAFQTKLLKGIERFWGKFVIDIINKGILPTGFPLKYAWSDVLPDQLLLADWERWKWAEKK
jgi:hypothetical protein